MKRMLLIISILFLTGCYDYVELNDLSIISMIIIDKIDNKYQVTFEILNDQKNNDDNTPNESLLINGSGYTISKAIADASSKTPKQSYFAHLKVLAVSKEIASNDLRKVIEYFLRAPHIRNEFYMVVINNIKASDIINSKSKENPIISDYITSMLENNQKTYNNVINNSFENIIIDIFEKGKDATIPVIKMDNNDLKAEGNALLDNYILKKILNNDESTLLNVLINNSINTLFSFKCPDNKNDISLSIYSGNTKINFNNNKINIKVNLMAEIEEYNCKDDLKNTDTFKKYNNYYKEKFKNKIDDLYNELRKIKTDSLGIEKILYNHSRSFNKDEWLKIDYNIIVNLKINKEGLIYEVSDEN